MKYTMERNRSVITLDTETGMISGATYQMKDVIKEDLKGKWNAEKKVWINEDLEATVEKFRDYLTRCYKLEQIAAPGKTVDGKQKEVVSRQLVNGSDGFYSIIHYGDGSTEKHFVG